MRSATEGWALPIFYAIGFALIFLLCRGVNTLFNHRNVIETHYASYHRPNGIFGHHEYTRYDDGMTMVKLYNGIGHRYVGSTLYVDEDGDGKVDLIRREGPEWKFNRLVELLRREYDYAQNQKRFDEADEALRDLARKADKKLIKQ